MDAEGHVPRLLYILTSLTPNPDSSNMISFISAIHSITEIFNYTPNVAHRAPSFRALQHVSNPSAWHVASAGLISCNFHEDQHS